MQQTRLDRYKVKEQMLRCKIEYFNELIRRSGVSQTVFYTSLDSYDWRSKTVDALANVLRCNSFDLLTIDLVENDSDPATKSAQPQSGTREQTR
mgnify:CR=1 FL=1